MKKSENMQKKGLTFRIQIHVQRYQVGIQTQDIESRNLKMAFKGVSNILAFETNIKQT